ncbi:MAG: DUF2889 domain-containing protein [Pseudomonadota bacterium]
MPLSALIDRELIHTRRIEISAHRRQDGLYDIEGHLVDVKPFRYPMVDQTREANEPVHDMWLRLTIDDELAIHDVDAGMDVGAHDICHEVTPNFRALIGLQIGPGWNRAIRERLGGGHGFTHLNEMLAQMATTAFQATYAEREMAALAAREPLPLADGVMNACYTYRPNSRYVQRYFPDQFAPSKTITDW